MIYCSLKQNTYYESSANTLDYKIVDGDGNVIYFGHSIKNPRTGINKINITEIISDYLSNNLEDNWPVLSEQQGYVYWQENAFKIFNLINAELTLETYNVLYDFADLFSGEDKCLTIPIDGKLDPRMKFFWTRFGLEETEVPEEDNKDYFRTVALGAGTITKEMQDGLPSNYAYRINNDFWIRGTSSSVTVNVVSGDVIEWYEILPYGNNNTRHHFKADCNYEVQGNIMSLLYGQDFENKTKINESNYSYAAFDGALKGLFSGNTTLISSENLELPATTLEHHCYANMFAGCINMVKPPKVLPGDTLKRMGPYWIAEYARYVYEGMFSGCSSLEESPLIENEYISIGCYKNMFNGCTSLISTPEFISTGLSVECYYGMFENCTSLETATDLPATDFRGFDFEGPTDNKYANGCYQRMFKGCISLVNPPSRIDMKEGYVPKYVCKQMFYGCTSITHSPYLDFGSRDAYDNSEAYEEMFKGCTSLSHIVCMSYYSQYNAEDYENWVLDVAQNGTFVKYSQSTWPSGPNGIPTGWTVQ